MKKSKLVRLTRKWHRYLGVILGVQFLLWTIGGLYFSWTNIGEIRGDHLKNEKPNLPKLSSYIAPSDFLNHHIEEKDSLLSLELTTILKTPIYRIEFLSEGKKKSRTN